MSYTNGSFTSIGDSPSPTLQWLITHHTPLIALYSGYVPKAKRRRSSKVLWNSPWRAWPTDETEGLTRATPNISIYIYIVIIYIYISYIDYLIIVLLLYNEFAQALWICDTSAPEHLDTQGVLQRRRRCCAPMLASPGPDRRSGVLRPLGCGIFHGALSGSLRFLGFKETSQILGPDTAGVFRKSLTLGLKLPG